MEVSSKPKSNSNMDNNENSTGVSINHQSVNKDSRLNECLKYLHRMIDRKDKEDIFLYPVTGKFYKLKLSIVQNI